LRAGIRDVDKFDTALQFVHEKLVEIRENSAKDLRASKTSLAKLVFTKPAPKSSAARIETPAPARKPSNSDKAERMAALRARALVCVKCEHLVKSRTQVVFGVGNIDAEVMFVGEAPGADEDLQGEPFVGKAGQLLTKII
jgi:uracil-DNA glycosylase